MKTFNYYLSLVAVCALLLTSCSKEEKPDVGNTVPNDVAVLSLGPVLNDMINKAASKQAASDIPACSEDAPAYAQISLTYGDSNTAVDVVVDILSDENGLFTAYDEALEIPIPAGATTVSVTLNSFLVWNDSGGSPGDVIWASPLASSDFGSMVEQALPRTWELRAGSKTYINVDVICFDERQVNLYGYQFFDIHPQEVYNLCFFANYCNDSGRHYTANYSLNLYYGTSDAGTLLYEEQTPTTGQDGEFYADPLCLKIPSPRNGEAAGDPYLYYEMTLLDWTDNYGAAGSHMASGTLSWNDVQALFGADGETTDYWHVFINCEPGQNDSDGDGMMDDVDNCPNVANPDQADADGDGVGDACDSCADTPEGTPVDASGCPFNGECDPNNPDSDCDNDGVTNGNDECPDTPAGTAVDSKGCESIQVPGRDVVVFNDANMFDDNAMEDPDNVRFVQNLVNYTTTGSRNDGNVVWIDRGRSAACYANGECDADGWSIMEDVISGAGLTVDPVLSSSGSLTDIPSDVKVIFLVMPTVQYTVAEINALKAFAAEGGRIIFVGEHSNFYLNIDVQNQFLLNMGAVLHNTGGYVDCGYTVIPQSSNRDHPIMEGITDLTIACASVIEPGPNDYPLFYDTTNTKVLAGVAKIDTTPITSLKPLESRNKISTSRIGTKSSSTGYQP